ncbi:MAG: MBL fold metallo-hydrolase [Patescibacteria group bacterium]|nr:MBL fold metallo-hydrolase [Patescibacteria group bacterium]
MQIKYLGREKFDVRSKDARIELGYQIKINGFPLPGPGEYEKSGIFIEGIADNGSTIYLVRADEINMCYLGKISHDLREDEAKEIGDVDILFVPLGEDGSLTTKKALDLVSLIDPKIVIPMLYSDLSEFKKSEGITNGETEILKIKKADLPENERMNVILKTSL